MRPPAAEVVAEGGIDGLYTVYQFAAVAASVLFIVGSVLTTQRGSISVGDRGTSRERLRTMAGVDRCRGRIVGIGLVRMDHRQSGDSFRFNSERSRRTCAHHGTVRTSSA